MYSCTLNNAMQCVVHMLIGSGDEGPCQHSVRQWPFVWSGHCGSYTHVISVSFYLHAPRVLGFVQIFHDSRKMPILQGFSSLVWAWKKESIFISCFFMSKKKPIYKVFSLFFFWKKKKAFLFPWQCLYFWYYSILQQTLDKI